MRIVAAIIAVCLSSCVLLHEQEADGATRTFAAIGGKGAYDKAQGLAYDNEKSFDTAVITAGTAYAAYQTAKSFAASEATEQASINAATKQRGIDAKASVAKERISASVEKAKLSHAP